MTTAAVMERTQANPRIGLSLDPPDADVNLTEEFLPTPRELRRDCPATRRSLETVREGREAIRRILRRQDDRFLVVVGPAPCMIGNPPSNTPGVWRNCRAVTVRISCWSCGRIWKNRERPSGGAACSMIPILTVPAIWRKGCVRRDFF